MHIEALNILCCPFCLSSIRVEKVIQGTEKHVRYGLLRCPDCEFDFPVIGGVVLLYGPDEYVDVQAETSTQRVLRGARMRDLVRLLKEGETIRALSLLLGPASLSGCLFPRLDLPVPLEPGSSRHTNVCRSQANISEGRWRRGFLARIARRVYFRLFLSRARLRLGRFLEMHRTQLSALDLIDLYYGRYSGVEMFNYFAFRYGMPRHLAGLSLASLLNGTRGPVLDLACGVGHLTHFLTQTSVCPHRRVIGIDRDFFRLYVACNCVAPAASFVCTAADQPLPFRADSLSGICCSDAYHLFLQRSGSIREMRRTLDGDGTLILARVGNGEVEPREGYELRLDSYRRLFGDWSTAFFGEDDLVDRYLQRLGPDLNREAPEEHLRREKWFSIVASKDLRRFRDGTSFGEWPHAMGQLQVNPIYVADSHHDSCGIDLRFQFPSDWYKFENKRYQDYAAAHCHITDATMSAVGAGHQSAEVEALVEKFVVLGMPAGYLTAPAPHDARRGTTEPQ